MSEGNSTDQKLFGSFPPVSTAEWEEAIRQDLGDADFQETLKWDTGEGIDMLPFYRQDDVKSLSSPDPGPAGWKICQQVFADDPPEANDSALDALEGGAEALQFYMRIHRADGLLGGDLEGTAFQNQHDFESILRQIPLDKTHLLFDVGMAGPALLAMLVNETRRQSVDPEAVASSLLYDPYAFMASNGHLPHREQTFQDDISEMVLFCRERFPGIRCLGVDTRCYHEAGATMVQEVALGLAVASEYFSVLTDRGVPARDICKRMFFSFSTGSLYFPEIARIRAVRLLWDRLLEAYEVDEKHRTPAFIHCETSRWNKTVYDPYTNLIRTTTEGMAAATGNCDLLTVHPFDLSFRNPGDFSVRLARNSQHILKEESFMDKVRDPARGSYYIEMLTDKIAARSWELFREIEQQGGITKALKAGTVAVMIDRSADARRRAVANRADVFVGTNRYPNSEERMSGEIEEKFGKVSLLKSEHEFEIERDKLVESIAGVLENGACLGDIVPALLDRGKQLFRTIHPWRGSEVIENLRLAVERHPATPLVLLLPMGDPGTRRSRSSFARQLFGCGGYLIKEHTGFAEISEALSVIRDTQPDAVVFCGSDREYRERVPALCTELDTLKKRPLVVLAGVEPGSTEAEQYTGEGVDLFVDRKSSLPDTLHTVNKKLGIDYDAT